MNKVILTFHDVAASQLETAVPILREMFFTGTLSACDWFRDSQVCPHARSMATRDLITRHRMDFELDNHSRNQDQPPSPTGTRNPNELQAIEERRLRPGLPRTEVHAYPGGNAAPNTGTALRQKHYRADRTAGNTPPVPNRHTHLSLPSCPTSEHHPEVFAQTMRKRDAGKDIMLARHSLPEVEHPWCHVPPKAFKRQMHPLKDAQTACLTRSQYLQQLS